MERSLSQRAHARTPGHRGSFSRSWEAGRGWNKKLVSRVNISHTTPRRAGCQDRLSWPVLDNELGASLDSVYRTGPQASQCRWSDACGLRLGRLVCPLSRHLQAAQSAAAFGFPQAHAEQGRVHSGQTRCSGKLSVCAVSPPHGSLKRNFIVRLPSHAHLSARWWPEDRAWVPAFLELRLQR